MYQQEVITAINQYENYLHWFFSIIVKH